MNTARSKNCKPRYPKLPIKTGKAHQMLSSAIICGNHQQASWIDAALKAGSIIGKTKDIRALAARLDEVMEPLSSEEILE